MKIRYGNYSHSPGEITLSVNKEVIETDDSIPYLIRERWDMQGMLFGDSEADINLQVRSLQLAYGQNGKDLALLHTDGSPTHLSLNSSACVGGTRIQMTPTFPDNRNAAYVTFLPYTIQVVGDVKVGPEQLYGEVDLSAGPLLSFSETISRSGGGPRFGMLEPLTGFPIRQQLKRNTIFKASQRGTMVGLWAGPLAPAPLWPNAMVEEASISQGSPRPVGSGADRAYMEYPVTWQYDFESGQQLYGNPNDWG